MSISKYRTRRDRRNPPSSGTGGTFRGVYTLANALLTSPTTGEIEIGLVVPGTESSGWSPFPLFPYGQKQVPLKSVEIFTTEGQLIQPLTAYLFGNKLRLSWSVTGIIGTISYVVIQSANADYTTKTGLVCAGGAHYWGPES